MLAESSACCRPTDGDGGTQETGGERGWGQGPQEERRGLGGGERREEAVGGAGPTTRAAPLRQACESSCSGSCSPGMICSELLRSARWRAWRSFST